MLFVRSSILSGFDLGVGPGINNISVDNFVRKVAFLNGFFSTLELVLT